MASASASAVVRSGCLFRNALLRRSPTFATPKRNFSSSGHRDDAYEAAEASKWEKIAYLGIATCSILAFYCLSKGHPHHDEPPQYPYLHIRNKEFPWGPDGLFETKHH